jgi:putative phosphoribosyl transferase
MKPVTQSEWVIAVAEGCVNADLSLPTRASGLVVLPQSRVDGPAGPRRESISTSLHEAGLATLTVHLLLPVEAAQDDAGSRRQVPREVLAGRLQSVCASFDNDEQVRGLPFGFFAAAREIDLVMRAAANMDSYVRAIVTHGGRPDLVAPSVLARVHAPTLLVVGDGDPFVVDRCREMEHELCCIHRIAVVPGATHLFAAPSTLQRVSLHAAHWFAKHLRAPAHRPPIAEEASAD